MITVKTIIEVIGFPEEHVNNTLIQILDKLEKEDGIRIIKKETAEARQVKKFFSAFVELELDIDDLGKVMNFCINYHPSSIELEDTESIELEGREITNMFNDLLATLHKYNMLTKNLEAQLIMLKKKPN